MVTTTIDDTPVYVSGIFNGVGVIMGGAILWINHTPRKLTTILENNQRKKQAQTIDRYCRVIVPVIFVIASIAIFAHPRG